MCELDTFHKFVLQIYVLPRCKMKWRSHIPCMIGTHTLRAKLLPSLW